MRSFDRRGTWSRADAKTTVSECLRLDAQELATQIDLTQRSYTNWQWRWSTGGGERTAEIGFAVLPGEGITLHYSHAGAPIPLYLAPIVTTVPNYGGLRYWFLCPRCEQRVRYLYCQRLFLCRSCHGLTYRTAQTAKNDIGPTITNQLRRLRRKLQADGGAPLDPCPNKPRHMHLDTYTRLWFQYVTLQRLYTVAWLARLTMVDDESPASERGLPRAHWLQYKRTGQAPKVENLGGPGGSTDRPAALVDGAIEWAAASDRLLAESERNALHRRLTLGEVATVARVPYVFAKEAQAEGLLAPDGGRGTRTHRYRRRLAAWLGKLHAARTAGLSWAELRAWSQRRWLPGHEHERQAPAAMAARAGERG